MVILIFQKIQIDCHSFQKDRDSIKCYKPAVPLHFFPSIFNEMLFCFVIQSYSVNIRCIGKTVFRDSGKSALNPPVVYSTDRSKAVIQLLVLLFVALWFILRVGLFYVLPCVI